MPTFLQIQNEIQNRLGDSSTPIVTATKFWINEVCHEITQRHPFRWRYAETHLYTVTPYTTGTVALTNGSATVTGTGTTWTAAMKGRKFRPGTGRAVYTISSVAATSITLTTPFQGTTIAADTYSIYQDAYRLPRDLGAGDISRIVDRSTPRKLRRALGPDIDLLDPDTTTSQTPTFYHIRGVSTDTFYSAGTATATSGVAVVAGISTAFTAEMVGLSFQLDADPVEYTIIAVSVAGQMLTLDRPYGGATAAGVTYKIDGPGAPLIIFYPKPSASVQIMVGYYRKHPQLMADNDLPLIPVQYHRLITLGAYLRIKAHEEDDAGFYDRAKAEFEAGIAAMILDEQRTSDLVGIMGNIDDVPSLIGPQLPSDYPARRDY